MDLALPPVVPPAWLADAISSSDSPVVVHVGTTMTGSDPYEAYLAGHLPGAQYVSLDDDLAAPPAPVVGRHPLPSPADFAALLTSLGVGVGTPVVAYDDRGGAFAARLVWMLRVIGQPAALLDGGMAAWQGALESGPAEIAAAVGARHPTPWPAAAVADADDVVAAVERGEVVIDSRDAPRYAGEVEPIDAVAGHVPGAINVPFADNLVDGRWRPADELAARFEAAATAPGAIVYCGSGVTACHNALAMEAAGLARPRVFVGSWSGWSTDPTRPVATGPE